MNSTDPFASPQTDLGLLPPVECPHCLQATDSLKQYEVVQRCIFLLFFVQILPQLHIACPRCMRGILWRRCLANVIPANLLWLPYILPRTLFQHLATYTRGPSREIADALRHVEV